MAGLLYACRKMSVRIIYIMNLTVAMAATLFTAFSMIHIQWWAGSPPLQSRHPMTACEVVMDLVILFWIIGAVGLFFRKRLAWAGSMIGVGATVSFLGVCLIGIVTAYIYPDVGMNNAKNFDGFGAAGYILAMVTVLTEFSLLLAICIRLLFGLLQVRKELFAPYNSRPL